MSKNSGGKNVCKSYKLLPCNETEMNMLNSQSSS